MTEDGEKKETAKEKREKRQMKKMGGRRQSLEE
jgi:hypothetical protein